MNTRVHRTDTFKKWVNPLLIESRWEWAFPQPTRPILWPTHCSVRWVPCLFPGTKADGTCHWPPTPSSAEVKERVNLYRYIRSGPSCQVIGYSTFFTFSYVYRSFVLFRIFNLNYKPICRRIKALNKNQTTTCFGTGVLSSVSLLGQTYAGSTRQSSYWSPSLVQWGRSGLANPFEGACPIFCINFEEILSRAHGNFEEQKRPWKLP